LATPHPSPIWAARALWAGARSSLAVLGTQRHWGWSTCAVLVVDLVASGAMLADARRSVVDGLGHPVQPPVAAPCPFWPTTRCKGWTVLVSLTSRPPREASHGCCKLAGARSGELAALQRLHGQVYRGAVSDVYPTVSWLKTVEGLTSGRPSGLMRKRMRWEQPSGSF